MPKLKKAVSTKRSVAMKQSWARRRRGSAKSVTLLKPAPTEQLEIDVAKEDTASGPTAREQELYESISRQSNRLTEAVGRLHQLSADTQTAEVLVLRTAVDLEGIMNDEHTSHTTRLALKYLSNRFVDIAQTLGAKRAQANR